MRSDPPADVVLVSQPHQVHLWFTEDLNGPASKIIVWDRYRHVFNQGTAQVVPGQARQLEVGLKPLRPGAYLVLWTSVSAQDGHVAKGSYLFFYKKRGPGPSLAGVSLGSTSQTFPDGSQAGSILAHWVELLSSVLWAGGAALSAWLLVSRRRPLTAELVMREARRERLMLRIGLILLLLASCVVLLLQAYSLAGNDWASVASGSIWSSEFSVQYGRLWIVRQVVVLAALALTFVPLRRWRSGTPLPVISGLPVLMTLGPTVTPGSAAEGRARSVSQGSEVSEEEQAEANAGDPASLTLVSAAPGIRPLDLVAVLGIIYLYLLAGSGHAASAAIWEIRGSNLISGAVFADWIHLLAVALWFGGQIYFVTVLMPTLRVKEAWTSRGRFFLDTLDRYSPVAYGCIALFSFSGLFNAKIHISSWYAFFNSIYGRALTVKVVLIGLMMLAGAYHVFWLRPRLRRQLETGEKITFAFPDPVTNLVRALHVEPSLGLGVLLAVSVMFYYPVPVGLSAPGPASYSASAGNLVASVSVTPDRSGVNTITAVLKDKSGHPVQQATVRILTTMLDMNMGTGVVILNETKPGVFRGSNDLGMGGRWRFQLLVYQPSGLTQMTVDVRVGT